MTVTNFHTLFFSAMSMISTKRQAHGSLRKLPFPQLTFSGAVPG
jgi:hypothetical protein